MLGRKKSISIESFFVVILLIIFSSAVTIMILQGSQTFDKIIKSKDKTENFRIANAYINMMVKQNDVVDAIYVKDKLIDNHSGIVIEHRGEEQGYVTYIYYKDGYLYEQYTTLEEAPTVPMSTKIVPLKHASFSYEQKQACIKIVYTYDLNDKVNTIEQVISLKSRSLQ